MFILLLYRCFHGNRSINSIIPLKLFFHFTLNLSPANLTSHLAIKQPYFFIYEIKTICSALGILSSFPHINNESWNSEKLSHFKIVIFPDLTLIFFQTIGIYAERTTKSNIAIEAGFEALEGAAKTSKKQLKRCHEHQAKLGIIPSGFYILTTYSDHFLELWGVRYDKSNHIKLLCM